MVFFFILLSAISSIVCLSARSKPHPKPPFMKKTVLLSAILLFALVNTGSAQSTYEQVYNIIQTKCQGAYCHGAGSSSSLNLSGTSAEVYNSLVNAIPANPAAVAAGLKLVEPGNPYRSLLMKKVNDGLDPKNTLPLAMGNTMPGGDTLSRTQRELIRQWILWGAKDTGVVHNGALINDYYTNGGIAESTAPLTPEEEGREGYQVKFGPVFLAPQEEFELFQVYNPGLTSDKEITEFHSKIPIESHHWALRKITKAGEAAFGVAPVDGANFNTQILTFQHTQFLAIWQFSDDLLLPAGTAHYQDSSEALLLNLHMKNYSGSQIALATAYLNVYTQPRGSAVEMKTGLSSYGGNNPFLLNIPATGQVVTFEDVHTSPGETRYFWNIQSHTHSRGKDFDMYLRNSDGSKGTQIYEGFYDESYTFNRGYYDYTHPAVRTFDPLLEVDMTNGLIFEASYLNNTNSDIPFGLTTDGEMFVTYFSYTNQLPTSIKDIAQDKNALQLYPNPARNSFKLDYTLLQPQSVTVEVYNTIGTAVSTITTGMQAAGKQTLTINTASEELPSGVYYVHVTANGATSIKKVVLLNN